MFKFTINAMVRGYHIYQEVWEVHVGEILPCMREVGNHYDPYATTASFMKIYTYINDKANMIEYSNSLSSSENMNEYEAVKLSAYKIYYG